MKQLRGQLTQRIKDISKELLGYVDLIDATNLDLLGNVLNNE